MPKRKFGGGLILTLATSAVVLASATSRMERFLQTDTTQPIEFNSKLPCYPCIMNGWIYCVDGRDHQHVDAGQYAPDGLCCQDRATCERIDDPLWTCSSTYSDQLLSLRMCPFKHDSCGTQSEFIFKSAGAKLDSQLTFYPSDVCFYTMRTECGVPAFQPQGSGLDTVQILTIEYDDADVDAENVTIVNGTTTSSIPIPKKSENFDGQGANRKPAESQLLYSKTNANGSVTYFYQNGTTYTYESPKVITYFDDPAGKDYEVQYPNKTNVTYKLDGSYTVTSFVNGQSVSKSYPSPSLRNLQAAASTTAETWGSVFFYMDGRIKEVMPNGGVYWNYKFYDPNQNPNRNNASAVNNTIHLRVKYNSDDGTFNEYWSNDTTVTHATTDNGFVTWPEYFRTKTADPSADDALTHPYYSQTPDTIDGNAFSLYTYTNDTTRRKYTPPTDATPRGTAKRGRSYDDIFPNGTIVRYFLNGTIATYKLDENSAEVFVKYIKAPTYLFEEANYHKFAKADYDAGDISDVSSSVDLIDYEWIQYLNTTERIYYRPNTLSDTRFYNMTSVKYEEHFYTDSNNYRVVFNNGTIALYYYCSNWNSGTSVCDTKVSTTDRNANDAANGWKTPRPYGTLGGLTAAGGADIPAISYGNAIQFYKFERLPFALAKEYLQYNNTDNSFYRVYEIEGSYDTDVANKWLYMYQNWSSPLNASSSTFDNNTRMLYNQSSDSYTEFSRDFTLAYKYNPCHACTTSHAFIVDGTATTWTFKWDYRVFVNGSAACFIKEQYQDLDVDVQVTRTYAKNMIGVHCSHMDCNNIGTTDADYRTKGCIFDKLARYNSWSQTPIDKAQSTPGNTVYLNPLVHNTMQDPFTTEFDEVEEVLNIAPATDPIYDRITKYHKNDTWFYFPRAIQFPSEYQKATAIHYTIRYRDLTTKTFYMNKTIAIFDANKKFIRYERAPTSFATYYPISGPYTDCSYWIDYTITNSSKRFIQGPIRKQGATVPDCWDVTLASASNTTFQIATAILYSDKFSNGTVRTVYKNGTIALFKFNGFALIFDKFEKAPTSYYVECSLTQYLMIAPSGAVVLYGVPDQSTADSMNALLTLGGWWKNCTNGTRFQYGPRIDDNTVVPANAQYSLAYYKATTFVYDDVYTNGTRKRFFRNGTKAWYKFNGFTNAFTKWEVTPTAYYEECTGDVPYSNQAYWPWPLTAIWKNCSVGASDWNATLTYRTTVEADMQATQELRMEHYTGPAYETYTPNGAMKRTFKNGTVATYQFNGLFYAFIKFITPPTSIYVDCDNPDFGYLSSTYDGTPLPANTTDQYAKLADPIDHTAIRGWTRFTIPASGTDPAVELFDSCLACSTAIADSSVKTVTGNGKFLCALTQAGPRRYKCYYEEKSDGTDESSADNYIGYFTNHILNPKDPDTPANTLSYDTEAHCLESASASDAFLTGCQYKCMQSGFWMNHGQLSFDFESDPGKVSAQCVVMDEEPSGDSTGNYYCLCLQELDTNDAVANSALRRMKWRNCTNGTNILEYETLTLPNSPTVDDEYNVAVQEIRDEVYTNGTRLRTYLNGTVAFINPDGTVNNANYSLTYNFSKSYECYGSADTATGCTHGNPASDYWTENFNSINSNAVGGEDDADYYKVRRFENGTIWWYLYYCDSNGASDPWDQSSSACANGTFTPLVKATQIEWYETTDNTPGQKRTVYYVNGTVTKETWTWTASARVATITNYVVNKTAFVAYTLVTRPNSPAAGTYWLITTFGMSPNLIEQRTYTANSSVFYYWQRPEDTTYPNTAQGRESKQTDLATGPYYFEEIAQASCPDATATSNAQKCGTITFRNGTVAKYKTPVSGSSTTLTQLELWQVSKAPTNYWYYVSESITIPLNVTKASGSPPFDILNAAFTLNGYELQTASTAASVTKITQRFYTTDVSTFDKIYTDSAAAITTPIAAMSTDQKTFNYNKFIATSYSRYENNLSNNTLTLYFRNGTIAQFNKTASVGTFLKTLVAPTSYFSWYTLNTYADGTKEYVYSDFYTITKGPNPAVPANAATNFDYQKIINTGLVDSYENRITQEKTANYKNGSIAFFKAGKFSKWINDIGSTWIWCDRSETTDYVDQVCTNGTTIRISKPLPALGPSPTLDAQFKAATYFGYMEIYTNGTSKTFYLNGSAAIFNSTGFVQWLIAPDDIWVGYEESVDGLTQSYTNGTVRTIRDVSLEQQETEIDKAIGYEFIDTYTNGSQQVFYRNGSVAWFNTQGFDHWITPPSSMFVTYDTMTNEDGTIYMFSNGTTKMVARQIDPLLDTEYFKRTSFEQFYKFDNGTTIVYYRNGTIARFNESGFEYYIVAPDAYYYYFEDNSYQFMYLADNSTYFKNYDVDETFPLIERATGIDFYTLLANGTKNVTYRNGTIAIFLVNSTNQTETFDSYVKAPTSYFVNYEDVTTDGIIKRTFDNNTVRLIYPDLAVDATRFQKATHALFYDTYPNGTSKKYFSNGTIAVYFQGNFMQYDVKPDYLYIDYPTTDFADGSYELHFFNGTRRFYTPPLTATNTARENKTGLWYTDCLPTGVCNFVYRNATMAIYQDGSFVKVVNITDATTPPTPTPSPTPTPTPTPTPGGYQYVNKTGPKRQVYDPAQGGVKKYKETTQSEDNRATKSAPAEPLCKGRNQMIIMADKRISSSVYLRRVLQVTDNDQPATLSLAVQSVNFIDGSAKFLAYGSGIALAILSILF